MSPADQAPPFTILLVEDNPADVRLTIEALRESQSPVSLHVAEDGIEAMAFLHTPGPERPRPDLILLDLNLPRKDGREVLQQIKSEEALRHIPVVILTTSQADQDVMKSYQLSANAYVTKPVDLDQFFRVVHSIDRFWFHTARLAHSDVPR
jgi:two-component system, chemotaxis family, response regulator Rcp1